MNRKMLTIILGVILIAGFFLAYWSTPFGDASGFDIVKSKGGNWQKYLYLIFPLCGIFLVIGAMNNGNYQPLSRNVLCWLPLLAVLYMLIIKPLVDGAAFGDIFKMLGKGYGIGWWATIAASLVLALYNPKE